MATERVTTMKKAKNTLDNLNDLYATMSDNIVQIRFFLKDYLRRLEVDEFDPQAVQKMKAVKDLMERLGV